MNHNSNLQLLLLQESWKDLFILHLSQWAISWDLNTLLSARQAQLRQSGHIGPAEEEVIDMEIKSMQVAIRYVIWKCIQLFQVIVSKSFVEMITYIVIHFTGDHE